GHRSGARSGHDARQRGDAAHLPGTRERVLYGNHAGARRAGARWGGRPVRAGEERGVAFNQFVRRTGIEDIKSLAAMIIQSEKFGTSLSQALKVYAEALRTRRGLRAEAAVGKAGIKMLFPIVVFILPVLFVITLVPGVLSVLRDLKLLGGGKP